MSGSNNSPQSTLCCCSITLSPVDNDHYIIAAAQGIGAHLSIRLCLHFVPLLNMRRWEKMPSKRKMPRTGRKFSSYFGFAIKIFFIKWLAFIKLSPEEPFTFCCFYKKLNTAAHSTPLHPTESLSSFLSSTLLCPPSTHSSCQELWVSPVSLYNYPAPPQLQQMDMLPYTYIRQSMYPLFCLSFFYNSILYVSWFWKAI